MTRGESVTLSSVARILGGGGSKQSGLNFVDEGYPAFGAGGLNGLLPNWEYEDSAVILSSIGARCGKCFFPEGKWSSLANTQLIFPDLQRVDRRYLWYVLNDEGRWHRSGSAQPYIKPSDVKSHAIDLPPLPEQRRIAAILDQVDGLREKRRSSIALAESTREAFFSAMFGDDGRIDLVPLSDVVREGTSITYGIVQAGPEVPNGVPYIRTSDLVNGQISDSKIRHTTEQIAARFPRSQVQHGEIVMSIRATVGTTAMVPVHLDGANLTQGTARIAPGRAIDGRFLLGFLQSASAQRWITAQAKGATFREITLGRLRELLVPVPEMGKQLKFADAMRTTDLALDVQSAHLRLLDELFASLQHRAFAGEL
jgi:type I restriction enzyme S subunit